MMLGRSISILKLFLALSLAWFGMTGFYFLIEWKLELDAKFERNYIFYTPACAVKRYDLLNSDRNEHTSKAVTEHACPRALVHINFDGKFIIQNLKNYIIRQDYEICGNWTDTYCLYVPYKRLKDNSYVYEPSKIYYADVEYIPLKSITEFVSVKCFDSQHHQIYQEKLFAVPQRSNAKLKENEISKTTSLKVSVLVLALDGISRENSQSLLPLTMEFLHSYKKSFDFFGYSNLGDDIGSNIIPIIKKQTSLQSGNDFVWKAFNDYGYTTIFAESNAAETLLNDFSAELRDQPTDYYFNPFIMETNHNYGKKQFKNVHNNFRDDCRAEQIWDIMTHFLPFYDELNFFTFFLVSRAQIHKISTDFALRDFLMALQDEDDLLFNTFVFVVSNPPNSNLVHVYDRGTKREMRVAKGQQPLLIALPAGRFQMKFPQLVENFAHNTKRLVTPLDLHATILDILAYKKIDCNERLENSNNTVNSGERMGMTLFCRLSKLRSCNDANIPEKFCPCDD